MHFHRVPGKEEEPELLRRMSNHPALLTERQIRTCHRLDLLSSYQHLVLLSHLLFTPTMRGFPPAGENAEARQDYGTRLEPLSWWDSQVRCWLWSRSSVPQQDGPGEPC